MDGWDTPANDTVKESHHETAHIMAEDKADAEWAAQGEADRAAEEQRKHKFGEREEIVVPLPDEVKWLAQAKHWQEGVSDKELEHELYEEAHVEAGIHFENIGKVDIVVRGDDPPPFLKSFEDIPGIKDHPAVLENITKHMKFNKPTPIQSAAIPILMSGRDVMATAQTGSGKTAAYFLPMIISMLKKGRTREAGQPYLSRTAEPRGLVIVPTRELASQVHYEARKFAYMTWIRPCAVYGGANTGALIQELRDGCDILVATPGKLMDFLDRGIVSLKHVKHLVIDEADRMFELGFDQDILRICTGYDLPQDESKRVALFSATFAKDVRAFAGQFVGDCLLVTVGRVGVVPVDIKQNILEVDENKKRSVLLDLLFEQEAGLTLIFVNTMRGADNLDDALFAMGFPITSIHGGRTQAERESSISAFRANKMPIMVATDVAGRGLDIPNIVHVINYDMPKDVDDYVHRIGRTARVGNVGLATSFFKPEDADLGPHLIRVLKETKQEIPEFLKQYEEQTFDDEGNEAPNDEMVVEVLTMEDLEAELPEGYQPLGAASAGGGDGGYGGEGGGSGDGDAWGAGGEGGGDGGFGGEGGGDGGFGGFGGGNENGAANDAEENAGGW
ncbi:DEAD-box ATP-dependent RNA helicase [Geranomyces variabilis]|nr:DEAD-box ATP-dependent RNA helicase [Geranomyces variabilis]